MRGIILLLFCCLILQHCNSGRFPADQLPSSQIQFGTGGGFSGRVHTYILLDNGQLFSTKGLAKDEMTALPDQKKKWARRSFEAAADIPCRDIVRPANRYAFLYRMSATDTCRWMWPAGQEAPLPGVEQLYRQLQEAVRP